jgi:predicted permease
MTPQQQRHPDPIQGLVLYSSLLLFLPRDLREEYGEEMSYILAERLKECRTFLTRGRIWARAFVDVLFHGLAERWRRRFARSRSGAQARPGLPRQPGWREERRASVLDQLRQDLVYSLRTLRRSPVYSTVVVTTLGVGIALNTVVFSVMNPFLLRPLPYAGADDLVHLGGVDALQGWDGGRFSAPQLADLRERSRAFQDLAGYYYGTQNLSGDEAAEQVSATWGTGNLFPMLGVQAAMGRVLGPEDDRPGAPDVVILSHGLWTRRYGSDPEVLGGTVRLNGVPHTVVGILPRDFNFPFNAVDLWLPMRADPTLESRRDMGTLVIGRLAEGWREAAAREEIGAVQRELAALYPEADGRYNGISIKPMREALNFAWDILRPAFLILLVGVAFVLVIACVNVAALTLARLGTRIRETALRQALGAGRRRLVRQFVVEATLLALAGGVLGVGLTHLGTGLLAGLIPPDIYRVGEISVDARVLVFSAVVTLSTPLFFAVLPAWMSARRSLTDGLKEGSSGGGIGRGAVRGRKALVVVEVALGVVLVAGTGLMMRSLANALATDVGFPAGQVLTAQLSLPESAGEDPDVLDARFRTLIEGLSALPGVASVGSVSNLPLNHEVFSLPYATPEGLDVPVEQRPTAHTSRAGPGYFQALGIPLLAGRTFDSGDAGSGIPRVVVTRNLAERLWPGESAVGRILVYERSGEDVSATVLGVTGDLYYDGLTDGPSPHIFRPLEGTISRRRFLVIRAGQGATPQSLMEPVRRALFDMDPDLPAGLRPMVDILKESTGLWAISSLFLGIFGLVALALAALGIYGVVAFTVSQRRREMGLRLALGARKGRILRGVVGEGLRLTSVGLLLGVAGAAGSGMLLSSMLLGVAGVDLPTLAAVTVVFLLVAAGSALVPARRAAAVEPAESLKME